MRWIVALVLLVSACGDPVAADATCPGDQPVHVIQEAFLPPFLQSYELGEHVVFLRHRTAGTETVLAGPCDAAAIHLADLPLVPARVYLDAPDFDPTVMCVPGDLTMRRVDLTGEREPEVLLPGYLCPTGSKHGALTREGMQNGEPTPLWLLPDFPARTGARLVADAVIADQHLVIHDDTLLYLAPGGELHAHDLIGGMDRLLANGVETFDATAERVVAFGRTVSAQLIDLHDEARIDLPGAVFDSWHFGGDDSYLLRETRSIEGVSTWAAFDLAGQPLELPAGHRQLELDDGRLVLGTDDGRVLVHHPGTGASIELDSVLSLGEADSLRESAENLEVLLHDTLWRLPLDGGLAEHVADGVGARRALDGERLLTAYDGELVVVDLTNGARTILDRDVGDFRESGGGLYYLVVQPAYAAKAGLWYLPPGGLAPVR